MQCDPGEVCQFQYDSAGLKPMQHFLVLLFSAIAIPDEQVESLNEFMENICTDVLRETTVHDKKQTTWL